MIYLSYKLILNERIDKSLASSKDSYLDNDLIKISSFYEINFALKYKIITKLFVPTLLDSQKLQIRDPYLLVQTAS